MNLQRFIELEYSLLNMADEKIYSPEVIEDSPLPDESSVVSSDVSSSSNQTAQTYSQSTIKDQLIPTKKIATELISNKLNTQTKKILGEFQFASQGAFKVGNYKEGDHGEIAFSPVGFIAKNKTGLETVAIDGETGDATFAGTLQAGTLISGAVAVGDGNILIDGATRRMLFFDENGIPSIIIGLVS